MQPDASASYYSFADHNLGGRLRLTILLLTLPLLLSFLAPLWNIRLVAPQYPDGLVMQVYSWKLDGGNGGHDIAEINELNHYIGMRKIDRSQLSDLDWMPFAIGLLALLALRVAAIGNLRGLIDLTVLAWYIALFGMARFIYRLYLFGHDLDPHAEIHMQPFTPVILGSKQVANFVTSSYPGIGALLVGVFIIGLSWLTLRSIRKARVAAKEISASAAMAAPSTAGRA